MTCPTCGQMSVSCWECGQPMRREWIESFGRYWVCRTCVVARLVEPDDPGEGWRAFYATMNRTGKDGGR